MSENGKECRFDDSLLFHNMQTTIENMQQQTLRELTSVQTSIKALEQPNVMMGEDKENLFRGCQMEYHHLPDQDNQQVTFELD